MTDLAIVDDSDLGRLNYTGTWVNGGIAPTEWEGTTHGSSTEGSQVTFQFNGTQVKVYGTIGRTRDSGLPISTYALDSSAALTYIAENVSATTYQNRFYQSPTLQDGLHTLVITVTSQGAIYWFDYILYTPSSNALASAPKSTSTTCSAASATTTISSCAHTNNSQSSSFPVGAIAGVLVGGLILGCLFTAGLLYYYWKKKPARMSTEEGAASGLPARIQLPSPPADAPIISSFPTLNAAPQTVYPTTPEQRSRSFDSGVSTRVQRSPSPSLSDGPLTAHMPSVPTS